MLAWLTLLAGLIALFAACVGIAQLATVSRAGNAILHLNEHGIDWAQVSLAHESLFVGPVIAALAGGLAIGVAAALFRRRFSLRSLLTLMLVLGTLASVPSILDLRDRYVLEFDSTDLKEKARLMDLADMTDGKSLLATFPDEIWNRLGVKASDVRGLEMQNTIRPKIDRLTIWINPQIPRQTRYFIMDAVSERFAVLQIAPRYYQRNTDVWQTLTEAASFDPELRLFAEIQIDIARQHEMLQAQPDSALAREQIAQTGRMPQKAEIEAKIAALEKESAELLKKIGENKP